MMVDSSAVVAILFGEPEGDRLARAIWSAPVRLISCVSRLECLMVVEARRGRAFVGRAEQVLQELGLEAVGFDLAQMAEALRAWQLYGRGRHPAKLNLGDCCAYGAAVVTGEPLLFKGSDFIHTDIARAAW